MKKVAFPILVAFAATVAVAPATWAVQDPQPPTERAPQTERAPLPGQTAPKKGQEASEILGMTVKDPAGENVGILDDLLLDQEAGEITHGIVNIGGFLGVGARQVAVAWNELTFNPETKEFTVEQPREQLEQAPAYEEAERPAAERSME